MLPLYSLFLSCSFKSWLVESGRLSSAPLRGLNDGKVFKSPSRADGRTTCAPIWSKLSIILVWLCYFYTWTNVLTGLCLLHLHTTATSAGSWLSWLGSCLAQGRGQTPEEQSEYRWKLEIRLRRVNVDVCVLRTNHNSNEHLLLVYRSNNWLECTRCSYRQHHGDNYKSEILW